MRRPWLQRSRLRRPDAAHDPEKAPPIVHEALRSPGKPLDTQTRAIFEPRFGRDFSHVRLHTDEKAEASAEAVNAAAYTVGSDVVFGEGRLQPESGAGQQLLAHELTHVAQQTSGSRPATPEPGSLEVEPAHSGAEREAGAVAQGLGPGALSPAQPAVQRSILGGVIGGVLGAVGGAALGFLAGGPVGAILGGILGATAGLAAGDAASSGARDLTSPEKTEAEIAFGDSLDYSDVQVAEAPIMSIGGYARTPFTTVYFPPGTFRRPPAEYFPFLIHELTHVWQSQHGYSVAEKLVWALHGQSAYDYGGIQGLRNARQQGKHFTDFNTEQQADILKDYYKRVKSSQDTSDYDPFVAEVKGTQANDDIRTPRGQGEENG
jgi:uncharacterized protein DUF4157